jgi:hydroxymethylglutaryl-CoA reductase
VLGRSSRLEGFYNLPVTERAETISRLLSLTGEESDVLQGQSGLTPALADKLIENVVGVFGLPLGIAANFQVNGRDVLIPMVVEEPSIVAGASFMAKLARQGGGFRASSSDPLMIGQVQVMDLPDLEAAKDLILAEKASLLEAVAEASPTIIRRGGGPRGLEVRPFPDTPVGPMLIVHLLFDCRDAMGANLVNTACESLAGPLESLTGGRVGLKILSNLADRRTAQAECLIPLDALAFEGFTGEAAARGIVEAWAFAAVDPYRAATHNKGIMNGIDPLIIATGNDWRAVEAGAHAYATRNGRYTSLSQWALDEAGNLLGSLEMPMALGIVGGSTHVHPTAKVALKILGVQTAGELAEIAVSVGLAQNLAALRALATEGIQRGHMALHARQIAVAAGADDGEVERLARQLIVDQQITLTHARFLLADQRKVEKER